MLPHQVSMHGWSLRTREAENRTSLWKEALQNSNRAPERVLLRQNEIEGRLEETEEELWFFKGEMQKRDTMFSVSDLGELSKNNIFSNIILQGQIEGASDEGQEIFMPFSVMQLII